MILSHKVIFSGDIINCKMDVNKLPSSENCASCHNIKKIYAEFSDSTHKDLECFDCHLISVVQKEKYNEKERGFFRLGYHKQNHEWVETIGNEACLRCHNNYVMDDSKMKCWSCHMPEYGEDNIVIIEDLNKPPTQDNIKKLKTLPHRSHRFKAHSI
ncbi:MAG: hypothetical protein ACFFE4_23595 [Candidatus Thorarchaeota archaeon]